MKPKSLQNWLKENLNLNPEVKDIREHSKILNIDFNQKIFLEIKNLFNNSSDIKPEKSLGLYWDYSQISEEKISLRSFYYIGYWWLHSKEGEVFIKVVPKLFDENKEINFMKVLGEIQEDPEVSKELFQQLDNRQIFGIKLDAPTIPTFAQMDTNFTIFVILNFLWIVKKLVHKGLKKDYLRISQNLNNCIKGKILIKENLQKNFLKGITNKVTCNFNSYTIDCVENRLIKTALWKIKQFINSRNGQFLKNPSLDSTLGFLLKSFEKVNLILPEKNFFDNLKLSIFYKEYKLALELAKIIFHALGFNLLPLQETKTNFFVIPYYINMALLFELYVYKKLREKYKNVFYQYKIGKYQPDFLILDNEKGKFIADAKYKINPSPDDWKQLSFYSRLRKIKELFRINKEKEIPAFLIFPTVTEEKEVSEKLLTNIKKLYISIPTCN